MYMIVANVAKCTCCQNYSALAVRIVRLSLINYDVDNANDAVTSTHVRCHDTCPLYRLPVLIDKLKLISKYRLTNHA